MTAYEPGLNVRLDHWAMARGWRLRIGVERNGNGRAVVTAKVGVQVGRGRTSNVALNELADLLASREGWPDDRAELGAVAR